MEEKEKQLNTLQRKIEQDTTLPLFGEANLVFGEGSADAEVVFIGEAPGFYEDQQHRPFVGQAGKLLDKMLQMIAWPRENVYITNIVKRRPPQNRDPLPEEIDAYKPYLARQIEIIKPKVVATLGRFSMNYFLPEAKISRDHGKLMKTENYTIYPLYHPAAALRATSVLQELESDFKKFPAVLEELHKANVRATIKKEPHKGVPTQASLF